MPEEPKKSKLYLTVEKVQEENKMLKGVAYTASPKPFDRRPKYHLRGIWIVLLAIVACSSVAYVAGQMGGYALHESHYQSLRTAENGRKDLEIKICEEARIGEAKNVNKIDKWLSDNFWSYRNLTTKK